jgi:hypothetical protein
MIDIFIAEVSNLEVQIVGGFSKLGLAIRTESMVFLDDVLVFWAALEPWIVVVAGRGIRDSIFPMATLQVLG